MNEEELAARFNEELDGVLRGGDGASFLPDPGAMALAAGLARADFSGDSLIKETLRQRLAGEGTGGFLENLRALFANNLARAALAAAVLLIALLPLARRHALRTPELPVPVQVAQGSGSVFSLPPSQAPAGEGQGLFASIPMAGLAVEPIKEFPIVSSGSESPIVLAQGREIPVEKGSAIIWETGGEVLTLEKRVITPADIFQLRTL